MSLGLRVPGFRLLLRHRGRVPAFRLSSATVTIAVKIAPATGAPQGRTVGIVARLAILPGSAAPAGKLIDPFKIAPAAEPPVGQPIAIVSAEGDVEPIATTQNAMTGMTIEIRDIYNILLAPAHAAAAGRIIQIRYAPLIVVPLNPNPDRRAVDMATSRRAAASDVSRRAAATEESRRAAA